MRIDYHDLSDGDFERLVVAICGEILGSGVAPFCRGPDGSRDARFEGTAAHLPNSTAPYKGKFIVQAKHTDSPVAKYSDADFSSPAPSSVISAELSGIRRLVEAKELDNYLLFSNRRMSGVAEEPIRERVRTEAGPKVVELFGIERIDFLLSKHRDALTTFGMTPLHLPLLVTCDDLAEVILAITANADTFEKAFASEDFDRISFKEKNEENGLSTDYADYIRRKYVPQFPAVKTLLAKPGNDAVLERYVSAADEFQEQIVVHRREYASFDHVLTKIVQFLFKRDGDLARRKAITKLVVFYMYWNCDIGTKAGEDAETE
jgi:hypothetical protein